MRPIQYRQGDVLLVSVDEVPAAVKEVARDRGRVVLAYGEATGHAHTIAEESATLVSAEQAEELYLLVNGEAPVALVHEEHGTVMVEPGSYEVRRQREYAPEENRRVAD